MKIFDEPDYEVIIIGGGPAGLNAGLMLARACRRVVVVDSGEPRNAAAKQIHGFLSRDGICPRELRAIGRQEFECYGCEILQDLAQRAAHARSQIHSFPTGFVIETQKGRDLSCRKVLFATGMCDKVPQFAGVQECYGSSIHHCPYCDGWEHRGKSLLAYGESASQAVGLGLLLRGWSADILVLTNGEAVSVNDRDRAEEAGLRVAEQPIIRFVHQGDQLQGVELQGQGLQPAQAMFFNTIERSRCDLARSLGVLRDDEFTGHTNHRHQTNIPGVFIAGDADGDVQFSIIAAAEGAKAAVAINRELSKENCAPSSSGSSQCPNVRDARGS